MKTKRDLLYLFLYEFKLNHRVAQASINTNIRHSEMNLPMKKNVCYWFQKFRSGNLSIINEPRRRPPAHIGTPKYNSTIKSLVNQACSEADVYKSCNVDCVLIENMHDIPYVQSHSMGPEIIATMTRICSEVRQSLPPRIKCGVQILAGANKEALAVAQAANLDFIRAEGYIFSHIADEGFMNSCAGELLRYRKSIDADNISILTDIKKKHCSHSITNDLSIGEIAKAAEFFLSDGVILTGNVTGDAVKMEDFVQVKKCTSLPVLIGSGVTLNNVDDYLGADAIIVGSHFKINGKWPNEVDKKRVQVFMDKVRRIKIEDLNYQANHSTPLKDTLKSSKILQNPWN